MLLKTWDSKPGDKVEMFHFITSTVFICIVGFCIGSSIASSLPWCLAGQHLDRTSGRCINCTDGVDFTSTQNQREECTLCNPSCGNKRLKEACTTIRDTICGCNADENDIVDGCTKKTDPTQSQLEEIRRMIDAIFMAAQGCNVSLASMKTDLSEKLDHLNETLKHNSATLNVLHGVIWVILSLLVVLITVFYWIHFKNKVTECLRDARACAERYARTPRGVLDNGAQQPMLAAPAPGGDNSDAIRKTVENELQNFYEIVRNFMADLNGNIRLFQEKINVVKGTAAVPGGAASDGNQTPTVPDTANRGDESSTSQPLRDSNTLTDGGQRRQGGREGNVENVKLIVQEEATKVLGNIRVDINSATNELNALKQKFSEVFEWVKAKEKQVQDDIHNLGSASIIIPRGNQEDTLKALKDLLRIQHRSSHPGQDSNEWQPTLSTSSDRQGIC